MHLSLALFMTMVLGAAADGSIERDNRTTIETPRIEALLRFQTTGLFAAPTSFPVGLGLERSELIVASAIGRRSLLRVDTRSGETVSSDPTPSPAGAGFGFVGGLAIADGRWFVAELGRSDVGRIVEIDPERFEVIGSFETPFRAGGVAFDGREVFAMDTDSRGVAVFSPDGTPIREFEIALRSTELTYHAASDSLWFLTWEDQLLETDLFGNTLQVCDSPRRNGVSNRSAGGIAISADGTVYASGLLEPDFTNPPMEPALIFAATLDQLGCR